MIQFKMSNCSVIQFNMCMILSYVSKVNSLYYILACECHALGSARDDCEQTTGRCSCRHGVRGDKCDTCVDSMIFAQDGTCIHGKNFVQVLILYIFQDFCFMESPLTHIASLTC